MPLGSDPSACTAAFITAIRERLATLDPPGTVPDDPADPVHANLAALGAAVYSILTAPGQAQTHSDAAEDATFWAWAAELTVAVQALQAALPVAAVAVRPPPTSLRGVVR